MFQILYRFRSSHCTATNSYKLGTYVLQHTSLYQYTVLLILWIRDCTLNRSPDNVECRVVGVRGMGFCLVSMFIFCYNSIGWKGVNLFLSETPLLSTRCGLLCYGIRSLVELPRISCNVIVRHPTLFKPFRASSCLRVYRPKYITDFDSVPVQSATILYIVFVRCVRPKFFDNGLLQYTLFNYERSLSRISVTFICNM
jgi:hypothetical protein